MDIAVEFALLVEDFFAKLGIGRNNGIENFRQCASLRKSELDVLLAYDLSESCVETDAHCESVGQPKFIARQPSPRLFRKRLPKEQA